MAEENKGVIMKDIKKLFELWNKTDPRIREKKILILSLIILHILPIWIFKYFPSQDGPSHIHNSYVLKALQQEQSTLLRECYKLNLTLFPNWVSHPFMAALMYLFPPLVTEKILLSIIISLLPLSIFYFLDAVHQGKNLYGFLGFLFSYHYLLHMGFYNFSLSVPLFFFALGYFMKNKEEMSLDKVALLNLLSILIYFCHIVTYILLILSLTLLSVTSFHRKPRRILGLLFYMLPLYFIMANYLLSSSTGQTHNYWNKSQLWNYFINTKSLVYYTDYHQIITRAMLVLLGLLFIATLYNRIRQKKIISRGDHFLLISAMFTAIYFILPWEIGPGGWINDRVNLFIFLVLLPFFNEDYHKYIRRGLVLIMVILSVAHLSISCRYYYPLNKGLKEFTSGTKLIEKNKSVLVFSSDWSSGVKYVAPFVQAVSYYCVNNGCVNLGNYEAKFNYFPLNWKNQYSGVIHYIVAWKMDENSPWTCDIIEQTHGLSVQEITRSLHTDYDLIYSTENLKLYRHKSLNLVLGAQ
ncbi:hypothetical protein FJZ31_27280 [Candidatus Poribacteria bacterium]|nr:hypothetical protein [Candidatus Poribacteria bacterium]